MRAFLVLLLLVGLFAGVGMVPAQETEPTPGEGPLLQPQPEEEEIFLPSDLLTEKGPPQGKLTQQPGPDIEPPMPPELLPKATPLAPALPPPPAPPPIIAPPGSPFPFDPPTPVVKLKMRVAACAPAGQQILYKICIENCSPAAAHHVIVRNPLPANAKFITSIPKPSGVEPELFWAFGTLPPGCVKEIDLVLEPLDDRDVKNCARVQFEHGQCVVTRIARAAPLPFMPPAEPPPPMPMPPMPVPPMPMPPDGIKPPVQPPPVTLGKLQLQMEGPESLLVNEEATYVITLTNAGDGVAEKAMIACDLPKSAEFVAASKGGHFLENRVAWLLGDLKPGEERTVMLTWKGKASGKICLEAFALADPDLQATAKKCTTFKAASGVGLRMEDTRDPVPVGEETSYVIVVHNQGSLPITNLVIKGFVPREMKVLRAEGPTIYQKAPAPDDGEAVLFEPVKSLEPDAEARFEVFVKALQPGDVRFLVEMTADQLKARGPVEENEATRIYDDDLPGAAFSLQGIVEPVSR